MICIGKGLHVSRSLRKAPCLRHVAAFVSPNQHHYGGSCDIGSISFIAITESQQ